MSTTITPVTDAGAKLAAMSASNTAAASSADEAQDRFLKLLVTQLRNQDPLNPMDNAQMTSQMAQISTVNGIEKLNATMQSMAASWGANQSLQATTMIGHNVLVPGDALQLQDGVAQGGAYLPQAADKVVITITDGSGRQLHKVDLGAQQAGVLGFQWDGATDSGAAAVAGAYTFSVQAVQGGNKVDATALKMGVVGGVAQSKDGVLLKINGAGQVALTDVKQVL